MKTNSLLKELIDHVSEYEQQSELLGLKLTMSDFVGFLNSKLVVQGDKSTAIRGSNNSVLPAQNDETDISILVVLLFRYAKGYIKKALKASAIRTADEFSFLITLMNKVDMRKTELIQSQIMEKTSGTEIINRLLKLGLVSQYDDPADKRSQRLKITALGRSELIAILPKMKLVSQIVSGNLSAVEKSNLAYMLRKLDSHHHAIYLNRKVDTLESLIE